MGVVVSMKARRGYRADTTVITAGSCELKQISQDPDEEGEAPGRV